MITLTGLPPATMRAVNRQLDRIEHECERTADAVDQWLRKSSECA